jgi:ribosomal protein S18 acetylase RimI-like enzyme
VSLERLDPRNAADVDAVATLHEKYFPNSLVTLLGPKFMREFHFVTMIEERLLECTVCRYQGRIVGFLAYTRYPFDFMSRALHRHRFALVRIIARQTLTRPRTLANVVRLLQITRRRARDPQFPTAHGIGEGISMAVIPEYQRHIPAGGTGRVSIRLFQTMVEYFRDEGIDRIVFNVMPDNLAANLFYSGLGCTFEKVVQGGRQMHRYSYRLDLQESPPKGPLI